MTWWIWIALGALLFIMEVFLAADFWLVFFGLAALVVGGAGYFGVELSGPVQWIVFTVLAVIGVFGLRGPIRRKLSPGGSAVGSDLVGTPATARGAMAPGERGQVDLRGTIWEARNDADSSVTAGQRCIVTGTEGVVLVIRPD